MTGARTLAKSLPGDADDEVGLEPRLTEIGNIMLSGFIDGWANYLSQSIDQQPPTYLTGNGADIIPDTSPLNRGSDQVLTVNSTFETPDAVVETTAYVFIEQAALEQMLDNHIAGNSVPIPLDKLQVFSQMAARGGVAAGDNITMMTGIETTVTISRMSFLRVEQIGPRLGDDQQVGVGCQQGIFSSCLTSPQLKQSWKRWVLAQLLVDSNQCMRAPLRKLGIL